MIAQAKTLLTLCPCLDVQESETSSDLQKDALLGTFDCCMIGRARGRKTDTVELRAKGGLSPSLPFMNVPELRRGVRSTRSVVYRTQSTESTRSLKASQELKSADEKQEKAKKDAHKLERQSSQRKEPSQKPTEKDILDTRFKWHSDSGLTPAPADAKLHHGMIMPTKEQKRNSESCLRIVCATELHGDCRCRFSAALFPSPHGRKQV
jgi:hypothetical protein